MIPSNDNHPSRRRTITVEAGDCDLLGLYLTCLIEDGSADPIDAMIFGSRDDAYDFALVLMRAHPEAVFDDQTGGGGQ
jgi:hypothetical protein